MLLITSPEDMDQDLHSGFIYNIPNWKYPGFPAIEQKAICGHPYNGILLSDKKKKKTHATNIGNSLMLREGSLTQRHMLCECSNMKVQNRKTYTEWPKITTVLVFVGTEALPDESGAAEH